MKKKLLVFSAVMTIAACVLCFASCSNDGGNGNGGSSGGETAHVHGTSGDLKYDGNEHWKVCKKCGEKFDVEYHSYSEEGLCKCGRIGDTSGLGYELYADGEYAAKLGSSQAKYIGIPSLYYAKPLKRISVNGFEGADIKGIRIPTSVDFIGAEAFNGCEMLKDVYYDGDIEGWSKIVFQTKNSNPLCNGATLHLMGEKVTDVVLPSSVAKLNKYAFYGCSSLKSITIGKDVNEIGEAVIGKANNLETITIEQENPVYSSEGNCIIKDGVTLVSGCKNSVIPAGVTTISSSAFDGISSLESIAIPKSVGHIGEGAFSNCESLKEIELSDNIRRIVGKVFAGCKSLTKITYSENLFEIGEHAFSGCISLKSIDIPQIPYGVKICNGAFLGCTALESVNNGEKLSEIGDNAFNGCTSLKSIDFGTKLTTIGSYAFSGCNSLINIELPETVSEIDDYAFAHCTNLTTVKLSSTNLTVGMDIFNNSNKMKGKGVFHTKDSMTVSGKLDKTVYYYSETEPTTNGNFWHYVDGEVTIWQTA